MLFFFFFLCLFADLVQIESFQNRYEGYTRDTETQSRNKTDNVMAKRQKYQQTIILKNTTQKTKTTI